MNTNEARHWFVNQLRDIAIEQGSPLTTAKTTALAALLIAHEISTLSIVLHELHTLLRARM